MRRRLRSSAARATDHSAIHTALPPIPDLTKDATAHEAGPGVNPIEDYTPATTERPQTRRRSNQPVGGNERGAAPKEDYAPSSPATPRQLTIVCWNPVQLTASYHLEQISRTFRCVNIIALIGTQMKNRTDVGHTMLKLPKPHRHHVWARPGSTHQQISRMLPHA